MEVLQLLLAFELLLSAYGTRCEAGTPVEPSSGPEAAGGAACAAALHIAACLWHRAVVPASMHACLGSLHAENCLQAVLHSTAVPASPAIGELRDTA